MGERGTPTGERTTVLIVDDVVEFWELLHRAFARDGRFEVVGSATNGHQAIAVAEDLQPDVIVLDDAMPLMDGHTALPEIRRVAPNSKIVFFSATIGPGRTAMVLADGAAAVVSKLAPMRDLFTTLEEVLDW